MINLNNLKSDLEKIKNNFKEEISRLRTGRATPDIINKIMVDCYGAKCPLIETAAITVENARTLRVQPWDKNLITSIEHAIKMSDIGVQPVVDKETLRVTLPELTSERRKQLIKLMKEKLEEARISAKLKRDDVWRETQEKAREGEIDEDEKFRLKDDLQKLIDKFHEDIDDLASKKEKEIEG